MEFGPPRYLDKPFFVASHVVYSTVCESKLLNYSNVVVRGKNGLTIIKRVRHFTRKFTVNLQWLILRKFTAQFTSV